MTTSVHSNIAMASHDISGWVPGPLQRCRTMIARNFASGLPCQFLEIVQVVRNLSITHSVVHRVPNKTVEQFIYMYVSNHQFIQQIHVGLFQAA